MHATEVSSTILEAEQFRVPTILYHPGEARSYRAVVERSWARVVDGFAAVPDAAQAAQPLASNGDSAASNERMISEGLAELLRIASGAH